MSTSHTGYGQRIRDARLRTVGPDGSMTQTELGKKIGVVQQTIDNWEREKHPPSLKQFERMATLFKTTRPTSSMGSRNPNCRPVPWTGN
jgi:DNA-binding XRE family transcriptional regulator